MKPISRAAIIAVGSEMLTPTKIDTNSLFITEQLNLLGIQVAFKTIVGDDRGDLETAVRDALTRVDLLVCCGGLGPTDDDLTRPVVADVLQRPLIEDEEITARIRARFAGRGLQRRWCRPADLSCPTQMGRRQDCGSSMETSSSCCCRGRRES
jgi:molybdenum cofactor synthesis domain-containing protein